MDGKFGVIFKKFCSKFVMTLIESENCQLHLGVMRNEQNHFTVRRIHSVQRGRPI